MSNFVLSTVSAADLAGEVIKFDSCLYSELAFGRLDIK